MIIQSTCQITHWYVKNPKSFSRMNHNSLVNKKWKLLMESCSVENYVVENYWELFVGRRGAIWCQESCHEMNGFWGNALREEGAIKTLFQLLYEIAGELATAGGEQLSNQSTVKRVLAIKLFNWSSIGCAASISAYQVLSCNQRGNPIPNKLLSEFLQSNCSNVCAD